MRRVLGEPAAIYLWLAVTLAGLVVAVMVGHAVWAVVGWAAGGWITIDELAGDETHRIDLTGDWWAAWQTFKDGQEVINPHEVRMSSAATPWRSRP